MAKEFFVQKASKLKKIYYQNKQFYKTIGILLFLIVSTLFLLLNLSTDLDSRSDARGKWLRQRQQRDRISILNSQLLAGINVSNRSKRFTKRNQERLLRLAKKRHDLLVGALKKDPSAEKYFFTEQQLQQLLPIIRDTEFVEKPVTYEGVVTVYTSDDFENETSEDLFFFEPYKEDALAEKQADISHLQLILSDKAEKPENGLVTIQGYEIGNYLFSQSFSGAGREVATTFSTQSIQENQNLTTGNFSTIVVPFYFSDYNPQSKASREEMYAEMFTNQYSAANFLSETSYGQSTLSGDVLDWVELSFTRDNCDVMNQFWVEEAKQKALENGVDVNNFDRIVYVWPHIGGCGFGGYTATGSKVIYMLLGFDGEFYSRRFVHELGHTWGLQHANLLLCSSDQIESYDQCSVDEYKDNFDTMGLQYRQFSSANKEMLGWIDVTDISKQLDEKLVLDLRPIQNSTQPPAKIFKTDTLQYYYIEYREPIGFDVGDPAGIYIRIWDDVFRNINDLYGTYLVDTDLDPVGTNEMLSQGEVFVDQNNHLKITHSNQRTNQAYVDVERLPLSEHISDSVALSLGDGGFLEVMDEDEALALGQDFTVESWVKLDNTGLSRAATLFNRHSKDAGRAYKSLMYINHQTNTADLRFAVPGLFFTSDSVIPLDEWVHIAITKEGNTIRGYLNGQQIAEATGQVNSVDPNADFYTQIGVARTFGNFSTLLNDYLIGDLDEFRISNVARDIAGNWSSGVYNSSLSVDVSTLGLWHFDNTVKSENDESLQTYPVGDLAFTQGTVQGQAQVCPSTPDVAIPIRDHYFGFATINGAPAPLGTEIRVYTERNELVGCGPVDIVGGGYRFISAWGENGLPNEAKTGDRITFELDGVAATTNPAEVFWSSLTRQQVDLEITQ